MKKILLFIIVAVCLFANVAVFAQNFSVQDTVFLTYTGPGTYADNITNNTGNSLPVKWRVIDTNFPLDWQADTALGICDASLCRQNSSMQLWNSTTRTGSLFSVSYPANSAHDSVSAFSLSLNVNGDTSGCYYMTISVSDQSSTPSFSKLVTFVVCKGGVTKTPAVTSINPEISLYPNPAHNEVNVVYDANADVKNIAVYNIIGKVMSVYKVNGSSANLNLENMPSGIYFVRLYNSQGNVVVTRKFTKQ